MTQVKRALGRSPLYEKPLTERVQVLFTEDHLPQMVAFTAASGEKDYTKWLRRLALGEIQHPNAQAQPANKSAIAFDLNEGDLKGLGQLAAAMYHEDANDFVKILVKAAIDAGPDGIRRFMYGLNERDLSEVDKARASS